MWAFGVLTYELLTGDTPFRSAFDLHFNTLYLKQPLGQEV